MTELKRGFLRPIYLQVPLKHSSQEPTRIRQVRKERGLCSVRKEGCKRRCAGLVAASPFPPSTGKPISSPDYRQALQRPPELNANLPTQLVPAVSLEEWGLKAGIQPSNGRQWKEGREDIGLCSYGWHWDCQILSISLIASGFPWSERQFYHTLPATMDFPSAGPKAMCQIAMHWSLQSH